ncbi:MFS general substrate transporter [Cadophora sp. DSE1049]|nr:MFS general substrate transporter [Cadophora sp. DSE1049]
MSDTNDVESSEGTAPKAVPHWRLVLSQSLVTEEVLNYPYKGSGIAEDPYLVEFIPFDPRNPMEFAQWKRIGCSEEVATLGLSLFVFGFCFGPTIWAPLSELYGRQLLFIGTYLMLAVFNAAAVGGPLHRLTNAGGTIADLFPANQRRLAMTVFAAAPFLGPSLGPVIGGFIAENVGWRWVEGIMALYCGTLWAAGTLIVPETYAPLILAQRPKKLTKQTGKAYVSAIEHHQGRITPGAAFEKALKRPWALLFLEPIVLLISVWMAILYGTLFILFGAFPIVFGEQCHWSQGVSGLAFLGLAVGQICG